MAYSREQLIETVCKEFGQKYAKGGFEGPHRVGAHIVHRVWTRDSDGEFHAHYTVETDGSLQIMDDFSPFANWIAERLEAAERAVPVEAQQLRERNVRLGVATMVVLVGVGLLVYLMVWQPDRSEEIKYLLSAIVGAAAGFVFGKTPLGK